jgi:peptidoglycan/xylan/chitin deacetylase (PgdA/CDA1 family)
MRYGHIGSHGGWAHNKFAADIEAGRDDEATIRELIDRNDKCLESVTHVPVRSFAAPVGVHPQPMMTHALDQLGIIGYYYTGDTGAPVERPFYDGVLVSTRAGRFP